MGRVNQEKNTDIDSSFTIGPGTSFPQEAFYYYIKQIDKTAINRDEIGGEEVDIHIPSLNIGIEYDGVYYHSGERARKKELRKNRILKEYGLTLIRVKEQKGDSEEILFEEVDGVATFTYSSRKYRKYLGDVIVKVLTYIFGECSIDINPLASVQEHAILESYRQNLAEMSLEVLYPEIAKQWHPMKNGNLKPSEFYPHSGYKVWWLCERGHEYESTIAAKTEGGGCPYCSGKKVLEGFNDLQTVNPLLAQEWHPTKNGNLKPTDVTLHSNKKVWWICKDGHEWKTGINNRARGKGCPYCSGRYAIEGVNDLQTVNPLLAQEWHPTKNGILKPSDVLPSSDKMVWWVCKHGHEWKTQVKCRTRGDGCPICGGKRVLSGFNDLQTKYPEIAKEWHPTKNGDLKPTEVTSASHKKIWWICESGHEWKATVADRTCGSGCPYCSGHQVLAGFNDLQTINPELAKEWHPTKNGNLKPLDVSSYSNRKVWWVCELGHEWDATVCSRAAGDGCPYCSGHRVLAGFNDLETKNPEVAKEWHPTKNGNLKPSEVASFSSKKVWWLCKHGHEWEATISNRTQGKSCPYCSGHLVLSGFNDLQTKNPKLAQEWHPTKNGNLKPSDVLPSVAKKVWWICKHGHEWEATINSRAGGSGCPYCAGTKVLVGFNDLQTRYPDVAKQWHPTKNGNLKPTEVTPSSHKKVWWICGHGHEWQAVIAKRARGSGCPECRKLSQKKNTKK